MTSIVQKVKVVVIVVSKKYSFHLSHSKPNFH
jgi:hypothetical protein